MTQAIIDNAAAIQLDRDLTVAITQSQSRSTKSFRRGPIQTTVEVNMNVVLGSVWKPILGALSASKLGPYTITFPDEVTGAASTHAITVSGATQTGTSVTVSSTANASILNAGDFIQFPGLTNVFVVTANVSTNASGNATVPIDYPLPSSPTNSGTIRTGDACQFRMLMIDRPSTSYGPTGLVAQGGSFRFIEEV